MNKKKEVDWTWIDRVADLHKKHGLTEVSMIKLREISPDDAVKAAEYYYKDYIINVGHPDRPELKLLGNDLEKFTIDEKPKVVGATQEVSEKCIGRDSLLCDTKEIAEIARSWGLDPRKLIRAYFK